MLIALATVARGDGLDYSFINIGWVSTDIDTGFTGDVDGDGLVFEASYAVADRVHIIGGLGFRDFDLGIDVNDQYIGVGYNTPFTDTIDFVASGEFIRIDVETPVGDDDDTGYGINIGLRGLATEQLEFNGFVNFVDVNESDFGVSFAAIFYPAPQWGIGASLGFSDDATSYGIGVRFYFKQ